MKNKYLILLASLLIAGLFYWYELRPIPIRQRCEIVARKAVRDNTAPNYEEAYNGCLRGEGLRADN